MGQSFIRYAKELVLNTYDSKYVPDSDIEIDVTNSENDEFLDHIFGKKHVRNNEVELYLKAPRTERNQDVLLWWKVFIYLITDNKLHSSLLNLKIY